MQSNYFPTFHKFFHMICTGCGRFVDIPVYCGNRFCEICGSPRALKIRRKLTEFLELYIIPPKCGMRMITLSVPNCENLPDGIAELIRCFRRLRQRAYWKTKVRGGAFVIEIKGTPGNWHPHIHAIVCSQYLNWNNLHKAWNDVSGGLSVYISNIPKRAVVNYILKYITKPSVSPFCLDDVANALQSKRLFQPFGDWHSPLAKIKKHRYSCPTCGHDALEACGAFDDWRSITNDEIKPAACTRPGFSEPLLL